MGGGSACVAEVIVCSDGPDEADDDDVVFLAECPAHLAHRAPRKKLSPTKSAGRPGESAGIVGKTMTMTITVEAGARPGSEKSSQSVVEEDDCFILDEDPWRTEIVMASEAGAGCSDDLVVTGFSGPVACRDYPHARHLCAQFPFETTSHATHCPQCHCYVCETRAPCPFWVNGGKEGNHCHAVDTRRKWKLLRRSKSSQGPSDSDQSPRSDFCTANFDQYFASTDELIARICPFISSLEQEAELPRNSSSADNARESYPNPPVSEGHGPSFFREQHQGDADGSDNRREPCPNLRVGVGHGSSTSREQHQGASYGSARLERRFRMKRAARRQFLRSCSNTLMESAFVSRRCGPGERSCLPKRVSFQRDPAPVHGKQFGLASGEGSNLVPPAFPAPVHGMQFELSSGECPNLIPPGFPAPGRGKQFGLSSGECPNLIPPGFPAPVHGMQFGLSSGDCPSLIPPGFPAPVHGRQIGLSSGECPNLIPPGFPASVHGMQIGLSSGECPNLGPPGLPAPVHRMQIGLSSGECPKLIPPGFPAPVHRKQFGPLSDECRSVIPAAFLPVHFERRPTLSLNDSSRISIKDPVWGELGL